MITKINEIQSIISIPSKKNKKISLLNKELSIEKIKILIKKPKAFDKIYVWTPNIKIPTKALIKPKYFAPLKPNEERNSTAKGKPNFWDGLPIKLEKI